MYLHCLVNIETKKKQYNNYRVIPCSCTTSPVVGNTTRYNAHMYLYVQYTHLMMVLEQLETPFQRLTHQKVVTFLSLTTTQTLTHLHFINVHRDMYREIDNQWTLRSRDLFSPHCRLYLTSYVSVHTTGCT